MEQSLIATFLDLRGPSTNACAPWLQPAHHDGVKGVNSKGLVSRRGCKNVQGCRIPSCSDQRDDETCTFLQLSSFVTRRILWKSGRCRTRSPMDCGICAAQHGMPSIAIQPPNKHHEDNVIDFAVSVSADLMKLLW